MKTQNKVDLTQLSYSKRNIEKINNQNVSIIKIERNNSIYKKIKEILDEDEYDFIVRNIIILFIDYRRYTKWF